jgi:tRNA C32,U32 (ribose-2'-O)-methylase TrmJ
LAHPVVQQMLQQPQRASGSRQQQQEQQQDAGLSQQQEPQGQVQQQRRQRRARIALVFGREEFGLSDEEVAACDVACAISIGRLQVS